MHLYFLPQSSCIHRSVQPGKRLCGSNSTHDISPANHQSLQLRWESSPRTWSPQQRCRPATVTSGSLEAGREAPRFRSNTCSNGHPKLSSNLTKNRLERFISIHSAFHTQRGPGGKRALHCFSNSYFWIPLTLVNHSQISTCHYVTMSCWFCLPKSDIVVDPQLASDKWCSCSHVHMFY